jgi:DNA-binding LacI/PurR family transcriptional regulator
MATPIWREIHDQLKLRIESGELLEGSTLPTEQDLAEQWGVSRLTAHRALYELQRSGLVTRRRKAGTVVNGAVAPKLLNLAAVFFNASDFFQGSLLRGLRTGLSDDVQLNYVDTSRDSVREAQMLKRLGKEADGVFLFPSCREENNALLARMSKSGRPIICVDHHPVQVVCDTVMSDNRAATLEALTILASLGHQRIAYLTDHDTTVSSVVERREAYEQFMRDAGIDTTPLVRAFPYISPNALLEYEQLVQLVHDAIYTMLSSPRPPTAILCLRDHYAAAIADACEVLGVQAPDDLQVIGFVDRPRYLMRLPDSYIRVQQDIETVGRIASERMLRRIGGESLAPEVIRVPVLPVLLPAVAG